MTGWRCTTLPSLQITAALSNRRLDYCSRQLAVRCLVHLKSLADCSSTNVIQLWPLMLGITAAHTVRTQREQLRRVRQYLQALFGAVLTSFPAGVLAKSRCPLRRTWHGNSLVLYANCIRSSGMEQLLSEALRRAGRQRRAPKHGRSQLTVCLPEGDNGRQHPHCFHPDSLSAPNLAS